MIAAAKRAQRALHAPLPFKPLAGVHAEIGQFAHRVAVNLEASRHGTLNVAVELDKICMVDMLGKLDAEHAAPDIHANQVWYHLVAELGSETDHAAFAPMRVGHNANLCTFKRRAC